MHSTSGAREFKSRQLPVSLSGLPTTSNLGCRVKEFPTPLPSPAAQAQATVQVVIREGRTVNIHMLCAQRPGLLLETMRALDGLGLDVQQAVISCFGGFALDVFRAEICRIQGLALVLVLPANE